MVVRDVAIDQWIWCFRFVGDTHVDIGVNQEQWTYCLNANQKIQNSNPKRVSMLHLKRSIIMVLMMLWVKYGTLWSFKKHRALHGCNSFKWYTWLRMRVRGIIFVLVWERDWLHWWYHCEFTRTTISPPRHICTCKLIASASSRVLVDLVMTHVPIPGLPHVPIPGLPCLCGRIPKVRT